MTIKVGDKIPSVIVNVMTKDGPGGISTDDIFKGKKIVMFGVPGAFTRTCSGKHLPGFVKNAGTIKAKGVDAILCLSVNDAFVMDAWGKTQNVGDKVTMVADGNAKFAKAAGLSVDMDAKGYGLRCRRFSMLVENGVVQRLHIDEPGAFERTSAEVLLGEL